MKRHQPAVQRRHSLLVQILKRGIGRLAPDDLEVLPVDFGVLRQVKAGDTVGIYEGDEIVAYVISRDRFESIIETMEIMANPAAMKAIRRAKAGKTKYYPLSVLDED